MTTPQAQGLLAQVDHRESARLSQAAAMPARTVADLIGEVILRGRSSFSQTAYRVDLHDFLF